MTITDREAYEVLAGQLEEVFELLKHYQVDDDFFTESPVGAIGAALEIERLNAIEECKRQTCVWCRQGIPLIPFAQDRSYRHENGGLCEAFNIWIWQDYTKE